MLLRSVMHREYSFWAPIPVQHCDHGVVSSGDIGLIGQFWNGSEVRALDHVGLIAQNPATLRVRGLLDDLGHRVIQSGYRNPMARLDYSGLVSSYK